MQRNNGNSEVRDKRSGIKSIFMPFVSLLIYLISLGLASRCLPRHPERASSIAKDLVKKAQRSFTYNALHFRFRMTEFNSSPKRLAFAIFLIIPLLAQTSFAFEIPKTAPQTIQDNADGTKNVCPSEKGNKGLIVLIVPCVLNSVLFASTEIFGKLAAMFSKTVTVICTLAIVFWGILVISGQPTHISRDGFILAIKVAVVTLFTSKYPELFPKMINIIEDLMNVVASPAATNLIWKSVSCTETFTGSDAKIMNIFGTLDCYLNTLIGGIFNPIDVKSGVIGFLIAVMFSSAVGLFISLIGMFLIYIFLKTIAKSMYIFIQAFVAFSLMAIISPLFVPLILFKATDKYFKQWADLCISFIIQPVFVMGYLVMFLMAFDASVFHGQHSIYHAIAGTAADDRNTDFKLGDWLNNNDVYMEKSLNAQDTNIDPAKALKEFNPEDTGLKSTTGKYPACSDTITTNCIPVNKVSDELELDTLETALNYFKTDTPTKAINWINLASKADPDGCNAVSGTCTNSNPSKEQKAEINKFLGNYKLKLFLTFVMAIIVIYIFYSMLEYMPFIGSGLISHVAGGGVPLGSKPQAASTSSGKG